MLKKNALEIFNNLNSEDYTYLEKLEAIVEVANMPTHNSVKKADMMKAIRFLAFLLKQTLEDQGAES